MTPNLRYINQSAPFWDWIASFEEQGSEHPFFARFGNPEAGPSSSAPHPPPPPPSGPWGGWHHHRHGRHGMPHRGPPPYQSASEDEQREASPSTVKGDEKAADTEMKEKDEAVP